MNLNRLFLAIAIAAMLGTTASAQLFSSPPPKEVGTLRELAAEIRLEVRPNFPWRYGRKPPSLLSTRAMFFPGEKVRLRPFLPENVKASKPLAGHAVISICAVNGADLYQLGEIQLRPPGAAAEDELQWTVRPLQEGEYLLAAHFLDTEGKHVASRHEVIWVTPEYPRLLAAAEAAVERARASTLTPLTREISLPSVEMLVEEAKIFWNDSMPSVGSRDWELVRENLETARENATRLAAGQDPYAKAAGYHLKAYRSDADGTLQPYMLYIPKSYSSSRRPLPLLVSLHGLGSNHRAYIRRVFHAPRFPDEDDYAATRGGFAAREEDFIVVSCFGRGEGEGYYGIGEQDVLRVVEDVQRAYRIDPDRIYLTGSSMGGAGTWHIGLRYPDRFAAIVPVCSPADLGRYARLLRGGAAIPDYERRLIEVSSLTAVAENARNLKVIMYHGDMDPLVPVEESRRIFQLFQSFEWGKNNVRLFEIPGVEHNAWDFSYRDGGLFRRLSEIKRDPFPPKVVYSTSSPRFNKAYWLRIDGMERGLTLARVEGEFESGEFSIKTRNVSALSILLHSSALRPKQPVKVRVDGKAAFEGIPSGSELRFSRGGDGAFSIRPADAAVINPPDHFEVNFRGRSLAHASAHIYVYGTGGNAEMTAAARAMAETLANWGPQTKASWKVIADTEVSQTDLARFNLVLVGNASVNRVVARIAGRLPFRDTGEGVRLGENSLAGKDGAYRLLYPNPEAPQRWVLIYGAGTLAGLSHFKSPAVIAGHAAADYLVVDDRGQVGLTGLFRDRWQIEE